MLYRLLFETLDQFKRYRNNPGFTLIRAFLFVLKTLKFCTQHILKKAELPWKYSSIFFTPQNFDVTQVYTIKILAQKFVGFDKYLTEVSHFNKTIESNIENFKIINSKNLASENTHIFVVTKPD